ncbi:hypothetical protein ACQPZQ_23740 [Pseudonocardia sp. CA-142604]
MTVRTGLDDRSNYRSRTLRHALDTCLKEALAGSQNEVTPRSRS